MIGNLVPARTEFLPGICAAPNCLNDSAPRQKYCRQCLISKNVMAREKLNEMSFLERVSDITRDICTNLYAVYAADQAVKFGLSRNPPHRLVMLQTSNHLRLTLEASIGCSIMLEPMVHEHLAPHQMSGEWFKINEHSLKVIELMKAGNLYDLIVWVGKDRH